MNNKHSFWSLSEAYAKIEIPIVQRDYAQGRTTPEVIRIREKFLEYLINSLLSKKKIEVDFVYGSVLSNEENNEQGVFIPLDGQQRLTTLFLLHWFLAVKEGKIKQAKQNLLKFTYETRPSAHDFCKKLIANGDSINLVHAKKEIEDSVWYNDEWSNDPTVAGMITMIDAFSKTKELIQSEEPIFESLIDLENPIISFYFIPLEKFGLTENLYIRMNARGKMLTTFENFKSEFYKIISYSPSLMEQFKDKIEYLWVENLWDYKKSDTFITDQPFVKYLIFITEMLYFKQAKVRAESYEKFKDDDFINFEILKELYSNEENLKFLIYAFDTIKDLKRLNSNILWKTNTSIHDILSVILKDKTEVPQQILLYSTLRYSYYFSGNLELSNNQDFYDYIRVIRNLVYNTTDKSRREWPRLFKSIESLISDNNIYELLLIDDANNIMEGFYQPQRSEEIIKARILSKNSNSKKIIFNAEDNIFFEGNITMLIKASFSENGNDLRTMNIEEVNHEIFDCTKFKLLLNSYEIISENNFVTIMGDLIKTDLYTQNIWCRLWRNDHYYAHPSIITMTLEYYYETLKKQMNLDDFLIKLEKTFVNNLVKTTSDLSCVNNVKEQLYLYYILTVRIMNQPINSFFKNGFNFGWLEKVPGFVSSFSCGIKNDKYFETVNPIFQTYESKFMYSFGLKKDHALDAEVVGSGRKNNPFELIINWAKS